MTKSVAEQFADIIEGLILAIEAQITGAPIPNRMAAPMLSLVRKSLEKLSASFAAAIARIGQAVLPPPVRQPEEQPRTRARAKPLTWTQRFRRCMPAWLGGPARVPEGRLATRHPKPIPPAEPAPPARGPEIPAPAIRAANPRHREPIEHPPTRAIPREPAAAAPPTRAPEPPAPHAWPGHDDRQESADRLGPVSILRKKSLPAAKRSHAQFVTI